ncbi:MAG: hypothetical protein HY744_31960 [Deltaproteobacteria bacterium]|nr:hypothetical protein [Deltaproteobacteria bacterium]
MARYIAESYDYLVDDGVRRSEGVVGKHAGSEKLYLHVLEVADAEIAKLGPRVDEHGNKQHDRLALPRSEDWWIAVEGEATWPGTLRPPMRSQCRLVGGRPVPVPLTEVDLALLRKSGAGKNL